MGCRGAQLPGWAHIGTITSLLILRETHIAPLLDFGLVTLVGCLIPLLLTKGYDFFFFFFFLSKETVWISTIFLTQTPHKQGLMLVYLGVVDYYCFWYVLQCGGPNNVGDLRKQPFYRFLEKTYVIHPIALGALLNGLGGFPFLVWGMVSKIVCLFILIKLYSTEFLGTRWMLKISTHKHTNLIPKPYNFTTNLMWLIEGKIMNLCKSDKQLIIIVR